GYSTGWGYQSSIPGRGPGYSKVYQCPHFDSGSGTPTGSLFGAHATGINWELYQYEHDIEEGYRLAYERLIDEARGLGAHGVVGAHLSTRQLSSFQTENTSVIEFTVLGTAVGCAGATPLPTPFTCHLSGQDLAKLMANGLVPASLILTMAAIRVIPGCQTSRLNTPLSNVELVQYGEAVDQCRQVAVERLKSKARASGEGVIGVDLKLDVADGGRRTEMMLVGTVVRRFSDTPATASPPPIMKLWDR
ncbi:MAG: heavy metal-binding domain-containing protein, partial [Acidimicrobiales bacterium]